MLNPKFEKIMPSIISDNEIDFPRGGGSGLTNLEVREIRNEVEADLEAMQHINAKALKKKKRSSSQTKVSKKFKTDDDVKVELLSFKVLKVLKV
jgi:rRNA biogenesis protein RRP5